MMLRGAYRKSRMGAVATILAVAAIGSPAAAVAMTPTVTAYTSGLPAGSHPTDIAAGADGNLWFVDIDDEYNPYGPASPAIGRITPAGTITEFSVGLNSGTSPDSIASGPDGNMWFTDDGSHRTIGKITPSGVITEYGAGLPAGSDPLDITAGPDGNVWFTDQGTTPAIGRITPGGTITEFSGGLWGGSKPQAIAEGPDGNLWFADLGSSKAIGKITPAGVITEYTAGLNGAAADLVPGSDGNVWFTDGDHPAIGRVTPAGVITEFSGGLDPGATPLGIAEGPDGSPWFTDDGSPNAIGRASTAGTIAEFPTSDQVYPQLMAAGADGGLWFTTLAPASVSRMTTPPSAVTGPAESITSDRATVTGTLNGRSQATTFHVEYGPTADYGLQTATQSVATSAGDQPVSVPLTGLVAYTTYHYRLVVTNPTDTTYGADHVFVTSPAPAPGPAPAPAPASSPTPTTGTTPAATPPALALTSLAFAPSSFAAAPAGPSARPAAAVGTRVTFRLSAAATVRFAVRRRLAGTRRTVPVSGSFSRAGAAGRNALRFTGRLDGRALPRGRYLLIAVAVGSNGTRSAPVSRPFTVLRRMSSA